MNENVMKTDGWVPDEVHYDAVEFDMLCKAFPKGGDFDYVSLAAVCAKHPHYAERLVHCAAEYWVDHNCSCDSEDDYYDQLEWCKKRLRRKLSPLN